MKKIIALSTALCGIALTTLTGCASIFGDNSKAVHVNSYPQRAQVYVNNMPMGTTPTVVNVPSTWSPTILTFKKKGYAEQNAQVNNKFQPVGLLNIFFWPGFVIDAVAGNMMKVAPESRDINVNLAHG